MRRSPSSSSSTPGAHHGSHGFPVLLAGVPLVVGVSALIIRARTRCLNRKLLVAVHTGDLNEVERLLKLGANKHFKDRYGLTCWMHATQLGMLDIADFLKEQKVDTNMPAPKAIAANLMREFEKSGSECAMTVLVARNGDVLYEEASGFMDVKRKKKADIKTRFLINSVTKQFTSAAILKLQEKGKLNVKDKVKLYYPEFSGGGKDLITLHHLLTHTSGIHNYTSFTYVMQIMREEVKSTTDSVDFEAFTAQLAKLDLDFEPGSKFSYSNSNYLILGQIVEKVTCESLSAVFKRFFFDPIGMNDTFMYEAEQSHGNIAKSGLDPTTQVGKLELALWRYAKGDGRLYSNVHDLMLWNEALFTGKVLNADSLDAAFTPPELPGTLITTYGYGFGVSRPAESRGLRWINHSGSGTGFTSCLARCIDHSFTVVALSNSDGGVRPDVWEAFSILAKGFLWKELQPRGSVQTYHSDNPKNVANVFEGQYDFGEDWGMLWIKSRRGSLFAHGPTLCSGKLLPVESGKALICRGYEPLIRFEASSMNPGGCAAELLISREGRKTLRGVRKEPIKVNRRTLRKYVGRYDTGGSIQLKGDKLVALHFGDSVELHPLSSTKFAIADDSPLTVEFIIDNEGRTKHAVVKDRAFQIVIRRL